MLAVLAAAGDGADLGILFVILALLAFGGAVWCAINNNFLGAGLALLVGVVILVVT